jgi:hypothetical protein
MSRVILRNPSIVRINSAYRKKAGLLDMTGSAVNTSPQAPLQMEGCQLVDSRGKRLTSNTCPPVAINKNKEDL